MPTTLDRKYAYQAGPEFVAAIRDYERRASAFYDEVIKPWDDAHPEAPALYGVRDVNRLFYGFRDVCPDAPPPEGLSRARDREWLVPRRGQVGQPWRMGVAKLVAYPMFSQVFDAFKVQTMLLDVNWHRLYTVGMWPISEETIYLTWGAEHPANPHLTPVPLSTFYAVREALPQDHPAKL